MCSYFDNFHNIDLDKRLAEADKISKKHPDRCCVIVARADGADLAEIDKHKFLVPKDLTVSQFSHVIRKRIDLRPDQAIFLFIGNTLPLGSSEMGSVYDRLKERDNFLYITYASENTFG